MSIYIWLAVALAWGAGASWLSRDRGNGLVERARHRVKVCRAWSLVAATVGMVNAVDVAVGRHQTSSTVLSVWMFGCAIWCWADAQRIQAALNHPLIYLVAMRDTFGGERHE